MELSRPSPTVKSTCEWPESCPSSPTLRPKRHVDTEAVSEENPELCAADRGKEKG